MSFWKKQPSTTLDLEFSERATTFKVEAYDFGFRAGTDLERMNQLVDSLEAEEFAKKLRL